MLLTKKIAYSCFVDAHVKYECEAIRWLWSLISKIKVSPADIYITCNRKVSQEFLDILESYEDINVFFEERFTSTSPPANKWLQLKNLQTLSSVYTHVVVSDCDKLFLSFSEQWCDDGIRACKFVPRPTFSVFEALFDKYFSTQPRFFIEKPDPKDIKSDTRSYVNNHNGGLIIIPTLKLNTITTQWKYWIDELLTSPEVLGDNIRNLDQVAFALTMHSIGSDINFIPKTLDLGPNIRAISSHVLSEGSGQLVLHIHGYDDQEGRVVCSDQVPDDFRHLVKMVNMDFLEWKSELRKICQFNKRNAIGM